MKKGIISIIATVSAVLICATSLFSFGASAIENDRTIYLQTPNEWTSGNVYVHFWNSKGDSSFNWQTKYEKMVAVDDKDNMYSYDVPDGKNGNEWEFLIFSSATGAVTCDTTFGQECFGDTAYLEEDGYYAPTSSPAVNFIAYWTNTDNYGSHLKMSVLGDKIKINGNYLADSETPFTVVDDFVKQYAPMYETTYPELFTEEAKARYVNQVIEQMGTYVSGDVTFDRKVNVADAVLMEKYIAKSATINDYQVKAGDVNNDSKIGANDVSEIQKHIAGISDKDTIGKKTQISIIVF